MCGHIRLGGFGVYYGEGDIRNVSQPLGGVSQTNNRAELMAVIFAVAQQPADRGLHVITDSEWVYKGITQWVRVWARNDWKSTSGDVHHRDLWEQLIALTSGRSHPVPYQHVPSHIGVPGNEGADRLAEEGRMQHPYVLATQAREPSVHLHQVAQQQQQGGDREERVNMVGHLDDGPQHLRALGLDLEAEAEIGGIDIEVEVVGVEAHIGWIDIEVEVVGVP